MFRAINEETAFVRQIKVLPEPAIILSSDYQLYDIHRFCTDPSSNCILTIDPTFSLGAFDVTPTTYRHLLLESQRYRTFPVCVGPVMIHYKKSFSTYHFFASSLVGLNRDISHLVAFGTDGELALSEAFSCVFPNALHLSCTIHARRNIMDKLKDLKFSDSLSRSVLNDIFGNRSSDTYVEGLIDAVDGADFDNRFLRLETSWSKQEKSDVGTDEFVPWFQRYKLDHFKKTMIGSVRKAAGLLPTEHFSTNASEAVNMILKSKMNYKKSDLPYLVSQIKELVFEQLEELDNALLNRGKFSVKSSFQDLVVGESSWHNMSEQQRLAHIERFHNTTPINQCDSSEAIRSSSLSNSINSPTLSELSISPSFATKCTSVSDDVILGIWTKAAKLVATKGAIAEAPGCSSLARNVISKSKSGFHTVKPGKNNRFVCDCPHYLSIKICTHSVATAEVNNLLPQFLKTVKPVRPNITKLVTGNMPKGRGRKGTKPPRKRTSLPPITSTINPFKTQISACSNTAHVKASSSSTSSSPPPLPPPIVSPSQSCEPPLYPSSTSSSPPPLTPPIVSPSQSCEPPLYPSSTSSSPPPLPPLIVSPFQSCEPPHYPSPSTSSNLAPIYYPQTLSYPSFLPPFSSPSGYLPYPPLSSYPPSSHQTIGQFNIVFIQGNISVCQGCNNKYQKPPLPPHDICLQHLEWREFIPQGSQTTRSKWGNAYYHCHPSCVLSRWPMFTSSLLNIDLSVAQRLLPLHKSYLCRHFGLSLP